MPSSVELWLVCEECGRTSRGDAVGWKAYLTIDEPPEVAIYCPDCAARELGDGGPSAA